MRRKFIAGNWKMNKTNSEAKNLVEGLVKELQGIDSIDIVVCPPFTALSDVQEIIKDTNISLGAQNMYFEEKGAFTGEISPIMLKDVGCKYVILGHSERRGIFGEKSDLIEKKVISAFSHDLIPILCVGETLEEREQGETFKVVESELRNELKALSKEQMKQIVIAYEPIWAIGTGKSATSSDAKEVIDFIRDILKDMFDEELKESVRILYGGSVKPDNISSFMEEETIDGALVGGASLKVDSFSAIVRGAL